MARIRQYFAVTTSNIRSRPRMPNPHVQHDCNAVNALAGINMAQEISNNDYKVLWRQAASSHGKTVACIEGDNPISVPHGWQLQSSNVHRVAPPIAGVIPERTVSEARLLSDQGEAICVLNTHTVPGSHGHPDRRPNLKEHLAGLAGLIETAFRDGYTVVYGGDMNGSVTYLNRMHGGALHPRARLVATTAIDHIWVVPAPGFAPVVTGRFELIANGVNVYTDHNALHVTLAMLK